MLYDIGVTTIGTLLGQIFNFFQEVFFASNFGTTWKADSYILALTIPTIIANELVGGISGVFIPVYANYREKYGVSQAKEVFFASVKVLIVITVIIMVLGIFLSTFITEILAAKFSDSAKGLTINLMNALFILIIFMPLTALFSNFLNAHNNFIIPVFGKIIIYASMIIFMIIFTKSISIYSVVFGIIVGNLMFLFLQIVSIKKIARGLSPKGTVPQKANFFTSFQHPAMKEMSILFLPLLFVSIANQVNILVERSIATRFAEGSLASLNYAIKLTIFPVNLFLTSVMTVLFPKLSKYTSVENKEEISSIVKKSLKYMFLILIPFTLFLILFRNEIVRIIFERGAFTYLSTKATATALGFYAPGLIGLGGIIILSKVYFAFKNTKTLAVIGISIIFLNIFSIVLFSKIFGFIGIPLAFSIVSNVHMVILYFFIRYKIK